MRWIIWGHKKMKLFTRLLSGQGIKSRILLLLDCPIRLIFLKHFHKKYPLGLVTKDLFFHNTNQIKSDKFSGKGQNKLTVHFRTTLSNTSAKKLVVNRLIFVNVCIFYDNQSISTLQINKKWKMNAWRMYKIFHNGLLLR